jgi:hypothetical protein
MRKWRLVDMAAGIETNLHLLMFHARTSALTTGPQPAMSPTAVAATTLIVVAAAMALSSRPFSPF